MGYIQQNLADGERVVYQTKLHRVIFVWPAVVLLIALAAAKSGLVAMAQIFLLIGLVTGVSACLTYLASELAVTNRRVFGKLTAGYASHFPEVLLVELTDVRLKRGFLAKLFDYGTVVVTEKSGASHKFGCVPTQFYQHLQERFKTVRRLFSSEPP
jgi:hypothetical protein